MEQKYILSAIDAALQAGADILSIYNDPASDFEIEKKADNSPLTIADRKAHETITGFLCEAIEKAVKDLKRQGIEVKIIK